MIVPHSLRYHFSQTALCNTVIDQPTNRTKDVVIEHILGSLATDTIW